jgi:hypothetical protein
VQGGDLIPLPPSGHSRHDPCGCVLSLSPYLDRVPHRRCLRRCLQCLLLHRHLACHGPTGEGQQHNQQMQQSSPWQSQWQSQWQCEWHRPTQDGLTHSQHIASMKFEEGYMCMCTSGAAVPSSVGSAGSFASGGFSGSACCMESSLSSTTCSWLEATYGDTLSHIRQMQEERAPRHHCQRF